MIIERATGGVAYASESVDVTTAIVDKFNEMVKSAPEPAAGGLSHRPRQALSVFEEARVRRAAPPGLAAAAVAWQSGPRRAGCRTLRTQSE
jgi:hypothetical protein